MLTFAGSFYNGGMKLRPKSPWRMFALAVPVMLGLWLVGGLIHLQYKADHPPTLLAIPFGPGKMDDDAAPTLTIAGRGLCQGGILYDRVTRAHPIGSSSEALRRDLERQGFQIIVTPAKASGYWARISWPRQGGLINLILPQTAEVAWRQDKQGRITEVGVQHGIEG